MKADRVDRISRFQREAEAMGRLVHQNIVQLYDFSRERDGSLYLAMEFLQGPTLSKILKERGQLPEAEAIELILPVLSAVEAAHKVGVIHRDLKPDNIVLATIWDGKKEVQRVKVVDFGVARLKGDSMTDAGQALGTPVYMAPEQAQGGDIDERVDIYGAGAVLYELLTGRPPFVAPDLPNANLVVLAKILTSEPPPLRERCPELSPALESVVEQAMCRDREQRFHTVGEFLTALHAAQKNPQQALWQKPSEVAPLELPPAVAAAASAPPPREMKRSMPPLSRGAISGFAAPILAGRANAAASTPQLGPGRAGPAVAPARGSAPASAASQPLVGRSGTAFAPVWASRSSQALTPVAAGEATRSTILPGKKGLSAVAYKVLIALVYLIAVSVILVTLLLDRSSCRIRTTELAPAPAPTGAEHAG
jgi:serine/threonine-protein kinase